MSNPDKKKLTPIEESVLRVRRQKQKSLREDAQDVWSRSDNSGPYSVTGVLPTADEVATKQHIADRKAGLERRAHPEADPNVKEFIEQTASEKSRTLHYDVVDRRGLAKILTEAKKTGCNFRVGRSKKDGYRYSVDIIPIYGSKGALDVEDTSATITESKRRRKRRMTEDIEGRPHIDAEPGDYVVLVTSDDCDVHYFADDHEADAMFAEYEDMDEDELAEEDVVGIIQFEVDSYAHIRVVDYSYFNDWDRIRVSAIMSQMIGDFVRENADDLSRFDKSYGSIASRQRRKAARRPVRESNERIQRHRPAGKLGEDLKIYTKSLADFKPAEGAEDIWAEIVDSNKVEDLERALENVFKDEDSNDSSIDIAGLNDLLVNHPDFIRTLLDLDHYKDGGEDELPDYDEEPVGENEQVFDPDERADDSEDYVNPNDVDITADSEEDVEPIDTLSTDDLLDPEEEYADEDDEEDDDEDIEPVDYDEKPEKKKKKSEEKVEESIDRDNFNHRINRPVRISKDTSDSDAEVDALMRQMRAKKQFAIDDEDEAEVNALIETMRKKRKKNLASKHLEECDDDLDECEDESLKECGDDIDECKEDIDERGDLERENEMLEALADGFVKKNFVSSSRSSCEPLQEASGRQFTPEEEARRQELALQYAKKMPVHESASNPLDDDDEEVVDVDDSLVEQAVGLPPQQNKPTQPNQPNQPNQQQHQNQVGTQPNQTQNPATKNIPEEDEEKK